MDKRDVYVVDFGGRNKSAWMSKNCEPSIELSHEQVLNLWRLLKPGDILIAERAHLGCPRDRSLAQVYTMEQLEEFYHQLQMAGIILKLFPEMQTPVAIARYRMMHPEITTEELEKDNLHDPVAIGEYLAAPDTKLTLQNPPGHFDAKRDVLVRLALRKPACLREEYWILKDDLNETLNIARSDIYDLDGLRQDPNSALIVENLLLIYNELVAEFDPELVQEVFGFSFYKKGVKAGKLNIKNSSQWNFNMGLMYTMLATLRDHDGNLRLRNYEYNPTGRFPSVYHICRYVICMTPFHMQGGIARSNIFWHGFRNYLRRITKDRADIDFARKITVEGGKKGDKVKNLVVNRGTFTTEERVFFNAERTKYVAVLKKLNRIYRTILMPKMYDENGYAVESYSQLVTN